MTARQQLRPVGLCSFDHRQDPFLRLPADDRADAGRRIERIARLHAVDHEHDALHDSVVYVVVNDHPRGNRAALPGESAEDGEGDDGDGHVQVGVGEN